jgi:transposase
METIEGRVWREARAMTRNEVIVKAIAGELSWIQAAQICGITARHMRRLKQRYERHGYDGLVDGRGGKPRRKRIPVATLTRLCTLKREQYADFSLQHFWEKATEVHKLEISYTWARLALQAAGVVEKSPGRGRYRRKRERRPMCGMMVHLDASTHRWVPGVPMQDLMVALDDADGRILYARFVPQENTLATLAALKAVVQQYGRFSELYTDRGSHFCYTPQAGAAPTTAHQGAVSRALKVVGIEQILARSPEARGRSERAFGTIQGRLPQELRVAGITDYGAANHYLATVFVRDFNRRFTVAPTSSTSAFIPLGGVDLELVLSVQHTRRVTNDSTVSLDGVLLQLPPTPERPHYVRCEVTVHEFPEGTLGVSYQGRLLARYTADGQLLERRGPARARPALRTTPPVALRAPSGAARSAQTRRAQSPSTASVQPSGHL